jgi:hypothetical protein
MAPLSPNSTIAHYRIIAKLGAAGTGDIYLAQDTTDLIKPLGLSN